MRTALILLLMLAAASVVGSLIPQIPNSPERVGAVPRSTTRCSASSPAGGPVRRLRIVVVHADHGAAVRLAGRVPDPEDARRVAVAARPPGPGARDRRVPSLRGARGRSSRRPMRSRSPGGPAPAPATASARDPERPALAADKGVLRETGQPAVPLGVHPDPGGVIYGKGTGLQRGTRSWWRATRGSTPRRTTTGRSAPAGSSTGSSPGSGLRLREFESAFRETGQPMDFVSRVDLLDARRDADPPAGHPREPPRRRSTGITFYQSTSGGRRVIRIADADRVLVRRRRGHGSRQAAPEGVPEFAMPWRGVVKLPRGPSGDPGRDRTRAVARQPGVLRTAARPASRSRCSSSFDPVIRYTVYEGKLTDPSPDLARHVVHGRDRQRDRGRRYRGRPRRPARYSRTANTPEGPTLEFTDLKQYRVFQVA